MPEPMSGVTGFDQYGDCVGPNGTASPYWKSVPGFKQDFSGDGCPDVLARHASDTRLRYWKGNCDGGLGSYGTFGPGWDIYAAIFTPGDFTGNGCADVMARASGSLYYWQGDCAGGLGARIQCCGGGWANYNVLFGPGYFDADQCVDIVGRHKDTGYLYYWPGSYNSEDERCEPGLGAARQVDLSSWGSYSWFHGPGDFNKDGCADIGARSGGVLYYWRGSCNGGVAGRVTLGSSGWANYSFLMGPGDFKTDGCADVAARRDSNALLYYWPGNCVGIGAAQNFGGTGWGAYDWLFAP